MTEIIIILYGVFVGIQILLTIILLVNWERIPLHACSTSGEPDTDLTVLIPVRNEASNIRLLLEDLEKQSYPAGRFEVLVLDDHSTDDTSRIVTSFTAGSKLDLKLLSMPEESKGKKMALTRGVASAKGKLIVTTDGDCRVGTEWLVCLESFYRKNNLKMISGGVVFSGDSLKDQIMAMEFASLVGSGAASLHAGFPNMCNGANLAYEKKVFEEVNGYQGKDNLHSGDDEFLMHKISEKYPAGVRFIKSPNAVVETNAPATWKEFFQQRKRWASKWENYTYTHVKLLALLIFAINFIQVLVFFMTLFGSYPPERFLTPQAFKFFMEFLFLRSVLVYFGKKVRLRVFLITAIIYPFYVILFAITGRAGNYEWKGRKIR